MRRIALVFMLVACLPLMGGCLNRLILSELALPIGIGVDLNEQHQRMFTFSQPNFSPYATQALKQVVFPASNLDGAVQAYEQVSRATVVLGQLKVVYLSRALAEAGIGDIIHDLAQTTEVGLGTYVLVSQESASEMMLLRPPEFQLISSFAYLQAKNMVDENRIPTPAVWSTQYAIDTPGVDPVLPYMIVDRVTQNPLLAGLALFQKDKMVGSLDIPESLAYQVITEKVHGLRIDIDLPEMGAAFHVELMNADTSYDLSLDRDGNWQCHIKISILADLRGIDNLPEIGKNITKQESRDQLCKLMEAYLEKSVDETVKKMVDHQVDPLGISQHVRAKFPDSFDEESWRQQYSKLKVDITVKSNIRRMGTMG